MRLGTVSAMTAGGVTITDDADQATTMLVDYWAPINLPTAGDRVLYEVIDGQVVVSQNVSSPGRILAGTSAITIVTANTPVSVALTFPAGWFSAVPRMYAGRIAGPSAATWGANFAGAATTGVTLWLNSGTAGAFSINWLAVQA